MLAYQGIFLAVTISTASVVLADVLVQPGYYYDNNRHNPSYQPADPQYQPSFPAGQYYTKQLTDQQLMPHPRRGQVVYPHNGYQNYYRPYLVGHPAYHHHHHHPYVVPHHTHYAKIEGHGYVRPSIFHDYWHPVIGHYRYKRSPVQSHDTTVEELAKPALVNHEVATKPSLMTTKYSTVIDSHLQENEPAGTDNKRSEGKRQSKNDHVTTGPMLFGLYPQNMHRDSRQLGAISDPTKPSSVSIRSSIHNMPKYPNGKSMMNSGTTIVVNPIQETSTTMTSQGTGPKEDNKNQQQNQTPLTDPNELSSSISSSNRASDEESVGAARDYYNHGKVFEWPIMPSEFYTPLRYGTWNLPSLYNPIYVRYKFPDPRQNYVSMKLEPRYQQNEYPISDKKSPLKSRKYNKEQSKTNQLTGASNPNNDYRAASSCDSSPDYSDYRSIYDDLIPVEMHNTYAPVTYPIDLDYYTTYQSSDTQINPMTNIVQTSPYVTQLLNTYDNPMSTRYVSVPQTYYHHNPALTYDNAPFEGTFSFPNYY
ncbi:uncharacterized protein LOC116848941 [Odontomachus brunneus]|uniref:uncharacterized protein LOC116848941 n=1 Tax=Odontomachus brunneus TaxID=486640 RepID=UPI0013F23D01|nr:uncharacterized protein LOC116848941 [Odontomachus brunneus]